MDAVAVVFSATLAAVAGSPGRGAVPHLVLQPERSDARPGRHRTSAAGAVACRGVDGGLPVIGMAYGAIHVVAAVRVFLDARPVFASENT
jgi:hypothetical protein